MDTRILIIEDNAANMELMRYLLDAHGYAVVSAEDGEAGVTALGEGTIDLVLCDMLLPKMDGYQVAAAIKGSVTWSRVPVIAVTALAMTGDEDKILQGGFDGYISKPIDPAEFVSLVELYLNRVSRKGGAARTAAPDAHTMAKLPPSGPQKAAKARILVVDDVAANADLLRSTLEPSGYEVLIARSATEGLALARDRSFHLIMSDLHMPKLNGLELMCAIRTDPELAALPVILISASRMTERERVDAVAAGADDCIARPIEPVELLARVDAALSRQR